MKKRSGFTLIATLITVAIICILMVVMMQGYSGVLGTPSESNRKDGLGQTTMGAAKMTAQDQVCKSNLAQVRESIAAARLGSDEPPQSLSDCGLAPNYTKCPIGGEPYQYDPQTGQVHCIHPGHENY